MRMARRPNLLLCFDAFGTLFRPKYSVAKQYGDAARQCGDGSGLGGVRDEDVKANLVAAMRAESKRNPNFGKATGLGATRWWTNVIHATFAPLVAGSGQGIPADLAPRLLHRFATVEAYELESADLASQLRSLKSKTTTKKTTEGEEEGMDKSEGKPRFDQIVIGVVTNSDDRVPGILSSAGFDVSPLRFGGGDGKGSGDGHDIDFHCMSYDVGVEKPDRAMFEAAESMTQSVLAARGSEGSDAGRGGDAWQKIYVGDEYAKDVVGSLGAGWHSVLLSQDGPAMTPDGGRILMFEDAVKKVPESITGLFEQSPVIGVRSIGELVRWLRNDV